MVKQIDSFRFVSRFTQRVLKSWIKREPPRPIPWTPPAKPLSECTVALLSSAGVALKTDKPFDQEGERQNPWWGDPSYRTLPRTAVADDIRIYHLHINPRFGEEDINVILPLERLLEMEERGEIGRAADTHYSIMGYILQPQTLLEETTPAIIRHLQAEKVDILLLAPA